MSKYRIGETAKLIGVSRHTIRNWLGVFSDYLSESANRHTGKRFTEQDIDTLKQIRELRENGFLLDDIPDLLTVTPEIVDEPEPPEPEPEPFENQIAPLEFFANVIEQQQAQHQREIAAKDETISILKEDNERLRQKLDKRERSFWDRLLGR